MTESQLHTVLKTLKVTAEKDGTSKLPDESSLTLYVAHAGAALTVSKVDSVKIDGDLVQARTAKKETFVVALSDIFAVAAENGATASRRTAGFA
jgi:hypothetical protein